MPTETSSKRRCLVARSRRSACLFHARRKDSSVSRKASSRNRAPQPSKFTPTSTAASAASIWMTCGLSRSNRSPHASREQRKPRERQSYSWAAFRTLILMSKPRSCGTPNTLRSTESCVTQPAETGLYALSFGCLWMPVGGTGGMTLPNRDRSLVLRSKRSNVVRRTRIPRRTRERTLAVDDKPATPGATPTTAPTGALEPAVRSPYSLSLRSLARAWACRWRNEWISRGSSASSMIGRRDTLSTTTWDWLPRPKSSRRRRRFTS